MKAAIVGAGHIAQQHLGALQKIDDVTIVGLCDRSPVVAESVGDRFGVPWFTDAHKMFAVTSPDVVHLATPVGSHLPLGQMALEAGAHLFIEKPITVDYDEWSELAKLAKQHQRHVLEDHNYLFNDPSQQLLQLRDSGELGTIAHIDIMFCLDLEGSVFTDPNAPHGVLKVPGGVVHDFLPHMTYLCNALLGRHRSVATSWTKRQRDSVLPHDEFRALVECEQGTANLAFSSHSQPDGFWLTVYAERMLVRINYFEHRVTVSPAGSGPVRHLLNGLGEGWQVGKSACGSLKQKLSGGPGAYGGLHELIRRTYAAMASDEPMPVTSDAIDQSSRLIRDLVEGCDGS